MQVNIEYVDFQGDPIVLPEWPKCPPLSDGEAGKKNRVQYSHTFLSQHGFTFSRNDTFGSVKKVIHEITPWLNESLAIALQIQSFRFGSRELTDSMLLSEYDTKIATQKGAAVLVGRVLDSIVAVCHVHMNVHLLNGKIARLTFDRFLQDSITCSDVLRKLEEKIGMLKNERLVRTYPGQRSQRFVPEQKLFGFKGISKRGLWEQLPYHGPIYPAQLPTPPLLRLELISEDQARLLIVEEDWWQTFSRQASWIGEMETYSGEETKVLVNLNVPTVPVWRKVSTVISVTSKHVHSLTTKSVNIIDEAGRIVSLADPDISSVRGPCSFTKIAQVAEVPFADRYLPTQEELSCEGKDYQAYQPGLSFGTGEVSFVVPGDESETKLPITYRLQLSSKSEHSIIFSAFPRGERTKSVEEEDGPLEYVFEGKIAKGLSECNYIKGAFYPKRLTTHPGVSMGLSLPFCVFQMTAGGTTPDVVSSPIGKRYSGLSARSFSLFSPRGKVECVGRMGDWTPASDLGKLLRPDFPLILVAHIVLENEFGKKQTTPVVVLWCLHSVQDFEIDSCYTKLLQNGRHVVSARTIEELEQALPLQTIVGFGNRVQGGMSLNPVDRFRKQHSDSSSHSSHSASTPLNSTPPPKRAATLNKADSPRLKKNPTPALVPVPAPSPKKVPPPTLPKPRINKPVVQDFPTEPVFDSGSDELLIEDENNGEEEEEDIHIVHLVEQKPQSGDDLLDAIYNQLQNPAPQHETLERSNFQLQVKAIESFNNSMFNRSPSNTSSGHGSNPRTIDDINDLISNIIKPSDDGKSGSNSTDVRVATNRFAVTFPAGSPQVTPSPLRSQTEKPFFADLAKPVNSRTALLDENASDNHDPENRLSRNISESSFELGRPLSSVGSDTSSFEEGRRKSVHSILVEPAGFTRHLSELDEEEHRSCCTIS